MIEAAGWLALVMSITGQALAARGSRWGWLVRLLSQPLWMVLAIHNHSPQYVTIGVIYLITDSYGYLRRRRRVSKMLDADSARRLVFDPRFPMFSDIDN